MTAELDVATTATPKRVKKSPYRVVSVLVVVVAIVSVLGDIMRVITISTGRSLFSFAGSDGRLPLSQLPQLMQADLRPGTSATLADADLSLRLLCASPLQLRRSRLCSP